MSITIAELNAVLEVQMKGIAEAIAAINNLAQTFATAAQGTQDSASKTETAIISQTNAVAKMVERYQNMILTINQSNMSQEDQATTIANLTQAYEKYIETLNGGALSRGDLSKANNEINAAFGETSRTVKQVSSEMKEAQTAATATQNSLMSQENAISRVTERYQNMIVSINRSNLSEESQQKEIESLTIAYNRFYETLNSGPLARGDLARATNTMNGAFGDAGRTVRAASTGFNELNQNFLNMTKAMTLATGPLSGVSARLLAFDYLANQVGLSLALVTAGVVGLTVVWIKAVESAKNFETGLTGVRIAAGLNNEETEKLGLNVLDLSKSLMTSTSEIFKIQKDAAQAGITGADNLDKFTDAIIKLKVTASIGPEEATTALAKLMNTAHLGSDQIEHLANVLAYMGNASVGSASAVAQTATQLAQTSASFGFTADQVLALSAALSDVSVPAELARTSIQRILNDLQKDVKGVGTATNDLSKIMHMSQEQMKEAFGKDTFQFFYDFLDNLSKLNKTDLPDIFTALGMKGQRDPILLKPLIGNFQDLGDKVKELGIAAAGVKYINDAWAVSNQTLARQLEGVGVNLENILTLVGQDLQGPLKSMVELIRDLTGNYKIFATAIEIGTIALSNMAIAWGLQKVGITGFVSLLGLVTGGVTTLTASIKANPIFWGVTAIEILGVVADKLGLFNLKTAESEAAIKKSNTQLDTWRANLEKVIQTGNQTLFKSTISEMIASQQSAQASIDGITNDIKKAENDLKNTDPLHQLQSELIGDVAQLKERRKEIQEQLEGTASIIEDYRKAVTTSVKVLHEDLEINLNAVAASFEKNAESISYDLATAIKKLEIQAKSGTAAALAFAKSREVLKPLNNADITPDQQTELLKDFNKNVIQGADPAVAGRYKALADAIAGVFNKTVPLAKAWDLFKGTVVDNANALGTATEQFKTTNTAMTKMASATENLSHYWDTLNTKYTFAKKELDALSSGNSALYKNLKDQEAGANDLQKAMNLLGITTQAAFAKMAASHKMSVDDFKKLIISMGETISVTDSLANSVAKLDKAYKEMGDAVTKVYAEEAHKVSDIGLGEDQKKINDFVHSITELHRAYNQKLEDEITDLQARKAALPVGSTEIAQIDAAITAIKAKRESLETLADAQKKATDTITRDVAYEKQQATIIALNDEFRQGLEDTLTAGVHGFSSLKDAAKQFIEQLIEMIVRLEIVKPLIESIFGQQGSSGGILGSIFGSFGGLGSIFGSNSWVTAGTSAIDYSMAGGGSFGAGSTVLVGENGPEILRTGVNGSISSNSDLRSMLSASNGNSNNGPLHIQLSISATSDFDTKITSISSKTAQDVVLSYNRKILPARIAKIATDPRMR